MTRKPFLDEDPEDFPERPPEWHDLGLPDEDALLDGIFESGIDMRKKFLTREVRTADLTKYTDKALEGRLAYYDRLYQFERVPPLRQEYKHEVDRTQTELKRRKMYAQAEANRVFEL